MIFGELTNCPKFNTLQLRNQSMKPNSSNYDATYPNDKFNQSKTLRWNIEECTENGKKQNKPIFTSSSKNLSKIVYDPQLPLSVNQKTSWQSLGLNRSNYCTSKSVKSIVFSSQEYETEKKLNLAYTVTDYSKKENRNPLRDSLVNKISFKDIMSSTAPNNKFQANDVNETLDRETNNSIKLNRSKSQKRLKIESKQNYKQIPNFLKQQFETNQKKDYRTKSSKKIIEEKYAKLKEQAQPFNKSTKYIRDELPIRKKLQKISSYQDHSNIDTFQTIPFRRHLTAQSSPIQFDMKEKDRSKLCINDFGLGKCKGEGAFGQVFAAIHKATKMLVAIKKVPKEKVKHMLEQFISEIKIQMFLNHSNIVSLYGFFSDTTNFYIIMEYMEGGSIYGLIKKEKKLKESQAAQKLQEICRGIKELHDNSILHRDIKPENIVLTNGVSKLCDFGWSAFCKDRRTTYCGTLDYVCPQIIQGQDYDDSVDIWCIGVLAYEMVCGKTPFYNISRKQTMNKIINVNYEYPSEVSQSARAFIDRILKRNPNERIGIDQVLNDKFIKS